MKRIAKFLVIAIVIVALGASAAWWFLKAGEKHERDSLTLYGNIDIRHVQLAFIESERIAKVMAEEGDALKKDQVVATLNTGRLLARIRQVRAEAAAQQQTVDKLVNGTRPQEIEQARAELASAKVQVKNASQNLRRVKRTAGTGATSRQTLDDARTKLEVAQAQQKVKEMSLNLALEGPRKEDVAAAKAQLESLQASLALLDIRLGDMVLKAPAKGVVESRILEPGDMAGPEKPVFTIALTDPKWVRAYVSEPDLGLVRLGMKASIQSDSFPKRRFKGWVGFISPTAEFTPKNVETEELRTKFVYEVRVFVDDPGDVLRLGMPITVTVDLDTRDVKAGKQPESGKGQSKPGAADSAK